MEYALATHAGLPDLALLERAVQALDPAALLDLDAAGTTLRIATLLPRVEVAGLIAAAGHPVTLDQVRQLPSICCGGCSG